MLTTCFPRSEDDWSGYFISQLAHSLSRNNTVYVVAPGSAGTPPVKYSDSITVRYFRYMVPASLQRLAYGHGIVSNLQKSITAWLCLPFFLICFAAAARKAAGTCDVIHANWIFSGLVALLARKKGKKVILTVRGSDINVLNKSKILGAVNRMVLKKADKIVTVSDALKTKILALGIPAEKVSTVPNGINTDVYYPKDKTAARKKLGLPENNFIILYIGRLIHIKGVDILLESLQTVFAEQQNAIACFVGSGDLQQSLQEKAGTAQITNRVRFMGTQHPASIPDWLNAADMLVLPSRSEGRPNVILEAFACATPVVASAVGGVPELIQNGRNGLLVPSCEPDQLSAAILSVATDETARRTYAETGPKTIKNRSLTWADSAARYEKLYRPDQPGMDGAL